VSAAQQVFDSLYSEALRRSNPVPGVGDAPPEFPFTFGLPDPGSFPARELVRVSREVFGARSEEALQYGNYQGELALRDVAAERLRRLEGVEVTADDLLITNGSSQALGLVCQALVDPGDTILVEGPTFLGAVRTFEVFGPRVVEVPLDDHGLRVDALERTLQDLKRQDVRPKFLYTLPNFHNPAGVTLSLERRRKLLRLAERYGLPILEDDAYGELRFEGRGIPSLLSLDTSGLVVRTGTFSKILAAGLRLGWICGTHSVVKRLVALKVDGGTNPVAAHLAATFANQGLLDRHIRRLRRVYRERRDAMVESLEEHCAEYATWTRPQGGFFVWVELKPGVDSDRALEESSKRGVGYLRGPACYSSGRGANQLRLAFSYLGVEQIREGIARLGEALAAAQRVAVTAR
jgi:2-aminoadipate transaminase